MRFAEARLFPLALAVMAMRMAAAATTGSWSQWTNTLTSVDMVRRSGQSTSGMDSSTSQTSVPEVGRRYTLGKQITRNGNMVEFEIEGGLKLQITGTNRMAAHPYSKDTMTDAKPEASSKQTSRKAPSCCQIS